MEIAMKTSSLFAVLAACLFVAPVLAQTSPDQRTIAVTASVPHADLDLGSAAGRASLQARIRHAVVDACGWASSADLRSAAARQRTGCARAGIGAARDGQDRRVGSVTGTSRGHHACIGE
jgi:UrcA family protein